MKLRITNLRWDKTYQCFVILSQMLRSMSWLLNVGQALSQCTEIRCTKQTCTTFVFHSRLRLLLTGCICNNSSYSYTFHSAGLLKAVQQSAIEIHIKFNLHIELDIFTQMHIHRATIHFSHAGMLSGLSCRLLKRASTAVGSPFAFLTTNEHCCLVVSTTSSPAEISHGCGCPSVD